jgi:hypothetical protein
VRAIAHGRTGDIIHNSIAEFGLMSPVFLALANGPIVLALKCRTTRFSIGRDRARSYERKGIAIV